MATLLFLFIAVPFVELALLIELGSRIGTMHTLLLIVFTGVVGASLARQQGLGVLRRIQEETARGQLPGDALLDGLILLVAGALLITPGLLTDAVGFAALVPPVRAAMRRAFVRWLEKRVREGRAHVTVYWERDPGGPVYDVTPDNQRDPHDLPPGL